MLRVSAKGATTWTVSYRVRGKGEAGGERVARLASAKRRLTLGDYPTVGLAEARARAAEAKRLARAGVDPADELRGGAGRARGPTVADLFGRYAAEHLRRNGLRSAGNAEKQLRLHVLPAWGKRPVAAIERGDLVRLIEAVRVPQTVEMRRAAGCCSEPAAGRAPRPRCASGAGRCSNSQWMPGCAPTTPSPTCATVTGSARATACCPWTSCARCGRRPAILGYPWGPWYRLILLTGDRRGEWARARWDWLDAERTRLEIPASEYKTGKPQVVPLSAQARAILAALPRGGAGPFLFSSDGGARPVSGFSKAKARLDRAIAQRLGHPLPPWVVHDLRRSMATHMERIGVAPHVIEVCLGHVLKGVAGTYRQYGYLPEKATALQRWADELMAASGDGVTEARRAPAGVGTATQASAADAA